MINTRHLIFSRLISIKHLLINATRRVLISINCILVSFMTQYFMLGHYNFKGRSRNGKISIWNPFSYHRVLYFVRKSGMNLYWRYKTLNVSDTCLSTYRFSIQNKTPSVCSNLYYTSSERQSQRKGFISTLSQNRFLLMLFERNKLWRHNIFRLRKVTIDFVIYISISLIPANSTYSRII